MFSSWTTKCLYFIDNNKLLCQFYSNLSVFPCRRYRYTSYRQLVRWCWGFMGKNIRIVLPACVVKRVRMEFPSAEYAGFKYPNIDWFLLAIIKNILNLKMYPFWSLYTSAENVNKNILFVTMICHKSLLCFLKICIFSAFSSLFDDLLPMK